MQGQIHCFADIRLKQTIWLPVFLIRAIVCQVTIPLGVRAPQVYRRRKPQQSSRSLLAICNQGGSKHTHLPASYMGQMLTVPLCGIHACL